MSTTFKEKRRKWKKDLGGKVLWSLETLIKKASRVGNPTFFDPHLFDWAPTLESQTPVIRNEVHALLQNLEQIPNFQDISTDQTVLTTDNKWKTYFLYGMGFKAERNCARCPETTRLIEQIPGMRTAFFSILAPHKHIPPHRGLYNGFIRYHLGLIVPEPREKVKIRVENDYAHWEEGKSLIFDDTYEHEVWNDTDGIRVVLFMDIIRPLRFPVHLINEAIIRLVSKSDYVQDARRNQEAWEKQLSETTIPAS